MALVPESHVMTGGEDQGEKKWLRDLGKEAKESPKLGFDC